MSEREKLLALAVGVLLLLVGLNKGYRAYQDALDGARTEQQTAEQALSTARAAVERGDRARLQLAQWQAQSLPANVDIAESLYQDWLHKQLTDAGLKVKQLREMSSRARRNDNYEQLTFSVTAQGSLESLVKFLYEFYRANHLHRISDATLKPSTDRKSLAIELTVDALVLSGTRRTDRLAAEPEEPLPRTLDDYRTAIVGRNLFVAYSPKRPDSPQTHGPSAEDSQEAKNAQFTGLTYGQGGWRMTVKVKDSDRLLYFLEGDPIRFGPFKGTVSRIDGDRREVLIETAEGMRRVKLGQNFGEAEKLPSAPEVTPEAAPEVAPETPKEKPPGDAGG